MDQISVVATVVDDRGIADLLAASAVTGRLAACAQVGGEVESTFRWRGSVQIAREWSVWFKTAIDRVAALVEHVRAQHPYETPEILVFRVDACPNYSAWVIEQTRPSPPAA